MYCSDISWKNPYSKTIYSICVPSLFVMSWTHQLLDLDFRSLNKIKKDGCWSLILPERFSRDYGKFLHLLWFWLGESIHGNHIPFNFSNGNSYSKHSYWSFPLQKFLIVIDAYISSFGITETTWPYHRVSSNGQCILILCNWGIKISFQHTNNINIFDIN